VAGHTGKLRQGKSESFAAENKELEASFNLRWQAVWRAGSAGGQRRLKEAHLPDHADLCVWLFARKTPTTPALKAAEAIAVLVVGLDK